jgi:hypothetical protein
MLATLHKGLRRHSWQAITLLLALALVGVVLFRFTGLAHAGPRYNVPHNAQMEAALGVRFTQAAVVGDTGLIELRYVVLDAQKASAFQNDTAHPPLLRNERSGKNAWRAALMKQGHELRPGQTYYLLYLNNQGAIHRGDKITVEAAGKRLLHVPVR